MRITHLCIHNVCGLQVLSMNSTVCLILVDKAVKERAMLEMMDAGDVSDNSPQQKSPAVRHSLHLIGRQTRPHQPLTHLSPREHFLIAPQTKPAQNKNTNSLSKFAAYDL
jgi:hypothetical protein